MVLVFGDWIFIVVVNVIMKVFVYFEFMMIGCVVSEYGL